LGAPHISIFISHVNGDPDAEEVLQALVGELNGHLAPTHDAYEIAYDRKILVGEAWRAAIYGWLVTCPAAVLIISKQAFDPEKPWVSHEATCLTALKAHREACRQNLLIIPVVLEGAEALLSSKSAFKPSLITEVTRLRFPDPDKPLATVSDLVKAIAERIKDALPPCGAEQPAGLAAVLRDKLSELPEAAQRAAAGILDAGNNAVSPAALAEQLLRAGAVKAVHAFHALCGKARDRRFLPLKQDIAHILGAQGVGEEDAQQILVEAAIPAAAGCGRALLLDCEDPDIIELYLTRASRRSPHDWDVTVSPTVLEYGRLDDLKLGLGAILRGKFGRSAGRSETLQLVRAKAAVASKRESGFPVLLILDYPAEDDPDATFRTIRDVCPDLMVLYTVSPEIPIDPPASASVCQLTPLGLDGYGRVIGLYENLRQHCLSSTPQEEAVRT
jgi:hypothetical protein